MSDWRATANRVIRETLARLPAGADLGAKRKALMAAYPFHERKMHPYRMWCKCVKEALAPDARKAGADLPPVLFSTHGVDCDSCRGEGCGFCRPSWERLEAWRTWNDGKAAKIAAALEELSRPPGMALAILTDCLESAGCADERVIGALRRHGARWPVLMLLAPLPSRLTAGEPMQGGLFAEAAP